MLDYCKEVLSKVSFNPILFEKELKKSLDWLSNKETDLLFQWCQQQFPLLRSGQNDQLD